MASLRLFMVNIPASLDQIAIAVTGSCSTGADLERANTNALREERMSTSVPIKAGVHMVIPASCTFASWSDTNEHDPHTRQHLVYWVARLLEAWSNVWGSAIGVMSSRACTIATSHGTEHACCDPTNDPFPSKPYLYLLPKGYAPVDVAREFGRDDNGWIELRRANADDPQGFAKQPNGYCWWNDWADGKRLRIPGNWSERGFSTHALNRLVDGKGRKVHLQNVVRLATALLKTLPDRWATPSNMVLEAGIGLYGDDAFVKRQVLDEDVARFIAGNII